MGKLLVKLMEKRACGGLLAYVFLPPNLPRLADFILTETKNSKKNAKARQV